MHHARFVTQRADSDQRRLCSIMHRAWRCLSRRHVLLHVVSVQLIILHYYTVRMTTTVKPTGYLPLSYPIFSHTTHTHPPPPPFLLPPLPIGHPWGLTATGTHLPAWPSAHDGTRARCATHTPPVTRIGDFLFQACGRAAPWTLLPASSHTTTPELHDTLRRPKNQPGFVRRASSPAVGEIGRRTVSASFDYLEPHLLVCKTRAKTMTPLRPHGRNHQTWTLLRTPSKRRSCRPSSMALSFTPFPGHASPACVRFVVARPPPGDFPAFPPAARVSSLVVPRRRHAVNCGAWLQLCSLQLPNLPASAAHGDGRRACERVSAALCVGDVHTHHVYARDPTVT